MNKNEMITVLHSKTGYPARMVEALLDAFTEQVKENLVKGEPYSLEGVGKFEVTLRGERKGRNPQTGEVVTFPSVYSPKMTFTKSLKAEINGRNVG